MTLLCCYRGFCCHTQPPSSLRQGWWGQPHHQGGGGEERGVRDTDSKYTERERERERETDRRDGCCLLWHTLTHHWVTAAGREEHPSLILFRRPTLPYLLNELLNISPGSTLFNAIRAWDTAEARGQQEVRVGAVRKQKDPSAPGTATMAPMVEEGSQLGESRLPFNTCTRPKMLPL